jgi:hypothetical protein
MTFCTSACYCHVFVRLFSINYKEKSKSKVPYFYLEYKQVTLSIAWVRYRHICSLFFDVVAMSFEALITAIDQRVIALVVKWCFLQTQPSLDLLDAFISSEAQTSSCFFSLQHCCRTMMPGLTLLAPQWASWTLGTGTFFPIFRIVLIWHHRTFSYSSNWRSTFEVCAPKLMKTSKRRSGDG